MRELAFLNSGMTIVLRDERHSPAVESVMFYEGGLIAFVLLLLRTRMTKFTPAQATAAIVVSYYWHFVDIVWIALFATIYFIR